MYSEGSERSERALRKFNLKVLSAAIKTCSSEIHASEIVIFLEFYSISLCFTKIS